MKHSGLSQFLKASAEADIINAASQHQKYQQTTNIAQQCCTRYINFDENLDPSFATNSNNLEVKTSDMISKPMSNSNLLSNHSGLSQFLKASAEADIIKEASKEREYQESTDHFAKQCRNKSFRFSFFLSYQFIQIGYQKREVVLETIAKSNL